MLVAAYDLISARLILDRVMVRIPCGTTLYVLGSTRLQSKRVVEDYAKRKAVDLHVSGDDVWCELTFNQRIMSCGGPRALLNKKPTHVLLVDAITLERTTITDIYNQLIEETK